MDHVSDGLVPRKAPKLCGAACGTRFGRFEEKVSGVGGGPRMFLERLPTGHGIGPRGSRSQGDSRSSEAGCRAWRRSLHSLCGKTGPAKPDGTLIDARSRPLRRPRPCSPSTIQHPLSIHRSYGSFNPSTLQPFNPSSHCPLSQCVGKRDEQRRGRLHPFRMTRIGITRDCPGLRRQGHLDVLCADSTDMKKLQGLRPDLLKWYD